MTNTARLASSRLEVPPAALAWACAAIALPLLVVAACLDLEMLPFVASLGFGVVFAITALAYGVIAFRAQRRVAYELRRAAAEWSTLCRELAAASRAGLDLDALLQQLGYREPVARQRLARAARYWGERVHRSVPTWSPSVPAVPEAVPTASVATRRVRLELDEPAPLDDPAVRITAGAVVTVACLVVVVQSTTRLLGWFWFGAAWGTCVSLIGVEAWRRSARVRREVARARREWDQLVEAAVQAQGVGKGLAALLQEQGYRVYEVRQWLLRHLERGDRVLTR